MIGNMKQSSAGIVMVLVVALAVSIQGIAAPDCVVADSSVFAEPNDQPSSSTPETTAPNQPPLAVPSAATFPRSAVVTLLGGERCCRISGQVLLEATIQNSIVP
jgi:hypothetical protein